MKTPVLALALFLPSICLASNATIVATFGPKAKNELLLSGRVIAEDFKNGNQLVLGAETDQDVTLLTNPDHSPESICFNGAPKQAADLLEAIIKNADGNGVYYLDAMEVASFEKTIEAKFTLVGQDGPNELELKVPACK